jgi:hypothetical protein
METLEECLLETVYIIFTRSCFTYYIMALLYPEINDDEIEGEIM